MQTDRPAPEHPHLRKLLDTLADTTAQVEQMRTAYTPAQLAWKPAPEVWNMLECMEHLRITGNLYYPAVENALRRADTRAPRQPYRPTLFGRLFIRSVSPGSRVKIKTLRPFKPTPALTGVAVLDRFAAQQEVLADLIRRAGGVNLNATKLSSPVSRLVRFTVGEVLTMLVTHQRRHVQQALRLSARAGFPAAGAAA